MIKDFIEETMGGIQSSYKLLYRATIHGATAADFHKRCDNKGSTVLIIKSTYNKIFGGFTS